MSKRLQVLLDEAEYREIKKLAAFRHMTIAEWVRQALREARTKQPENEKHTKIRAVRTAIEFNFPTADIEQILDDIESGYTSV